MTRQISDTRIVSSQPLINPWVLAQEIPATDSIAAFIGSARDEIAEILRGNDQRQLVIVGPCSVHDPKALLEFGQRLKEFEASVKDALFLVLRVYFEKPRTVAGWKGLINDPDLDGSFRVNKGLKLARQVLRDVAELGLAAASEFLDTTLGQYYADLVSFGAIGARTVESQVHRELASGLSMPVGFKNATSGEVSVAIDAIRSARESHRFPSLTREGTPAILQASGNPDCYLILRGGAQSGPNYHAADVNAAVEKMKQAGVTPGLLVDCSHGNSSKDHEKQGLVIADVCNQIKHEQHGIRGVMLESHLRSGNQAIDTLHSLTYGQSVTDACLALDDTLPLLDQLAETVRATR